MREIKPYRTESGLMKALDNGGRLYNIMSRGGDNIITYAELAKASGAVSTGVYAFLFFEMAQQDLPSEARDRAVAALEPRLRKEYKKDRPATLSPSEACSLAVPGRPVVVSGYNRPLKDRKAMAAKVGVSVTAGGGTGYEKVALVDKFAVFEIFDDARMRGAKVLLAADRGTELPSDQKIRFGGIVRRLYYESQDSKNPPLFVESIFYTRL